MVKELFGFKVIDDTQSVHVGDVLELVQDNERNSSAKIGERVEVTGRGTISHRRNPNWKNACLGRVWKIAKKTEFPGIDGEWCHEPGSPAMQAIVDKPGSDNTSRGVKILEQTIVVGAWYELHHPSDAGVRLLEAQSNSFVGCIEKFDDLQSDYSLHEFPERAFTIADVVNRIDSTVLVAEDGSLWGGKQSENIHCLDPNAPPWVQLSPEQRFVLFYDEHTPAVLRQIATDTEQPDTGRPDINHTVDVVPGYEPLFKELVAALNQSQAGKGKERHAEDGQPFLEQPILTNARQCGAGGPAQQVMKKTGEAIGMHKRGQTDRAVAELHGAMVYAAATILIMKEESKS